MICSHDDLATRYCPHCGAENPECSLTWLVEALENFEANGHRIKISAMHAEAWSEEITEIMNRAIHRMSPSARRTATTPAPIVELRRCEPVGFSESDANGIAKGMKQ